MREEVITSIFPTLCHGKVNKVSSPFGLPCSPSFPRIVNVRLAPHYAPVNNIYYWYSLTAGVRARLKAVSGCALRNPIRPFTAGFVRAHLTNTSSADIATELRCSPFDAYLDAFFGALIRSCARFAFPLMAVPENLAIPFRGCLTPMLTESLYRA